jgi:hypothetical protein
VLLDKLLTSRDGQQVLQSQKSKLIQESELIQKSQINPAAIINRHYVKKGTHNQHNEEDVILTTAGSLDLSVDESLVNER